MRNALLCLGMWTATVHAQLPTWVDDIAPLVHSHCAHCHHNGGAGPFPLLTYEDVFFTAFMDLHVMQDGEMPPWPADPAYNHFVGENVLSDEDVVTSVPRYVLAFRTGREGRARDCGRPDGALSAVEAPQKSLRMGPQN